MDDTTAAAATTTTTTPPEAPQPEQRVITAADIQRTAHTHGPDAPDFEWLGCPGCMVDSVASAVLSVVSQFQAAGAATMPAITEGLVLGVLKHVTQQHGTTKALLFVEAMAVATIKPLGADKTGFSVRELNVFNAPFLGEGADADADAAAVEGAGDEPQQQAAQ